MTITERQKQILDGVISEYVEKAQPVSSKVLEKKYDFGVSPATLRNEMASLSKKGFLEKPHTSSGSVPTDKGYRFYVNELKNGKVNEIQNMRGERDKPADPPTSKEVVAGQADMNFGWHMARNLAFLSSNLGAVYFPEEDMLWKEGWEQLLGEPEFESQEGLHSFAKFIQDFEKKLGTFSLDEGIQTFIGKENPFSKIKDFSVIIASCEFPVGERAMVALLGPKRMEYTKNIHIVDECIQMIQHTKHD